MRDWKDLIIYDFDEIIDYNKERYNETNTFIEPITITGVVTNESAIPGNDGSINISVSGGTGPYTYLWSNNATTQDISNLVSGSYNVKVTDSKGCKQVNYFTVYDSQDIIIQTHTVTGESGCGEDDGSIYIKVTGGTTPYVYDWILTNDFGEILEISGATNNTGILEFNNLAAGTHAKIEISSLNLFNSITIYDDYIDYYDSNIIITISIFYLACGQNSRDVTVFAQGGATPYTYKWFDGTTGATINLEATQCWVLVTDANGCRKKVPIYVNEPLPVSVDIVNLGLNDNCYGAESIYQTYCYGFLGNITYQWYKNDVLINDAISNYYTTSESGTYKVVATDIITNCSATGTTNNNVIQVVVVSGTVTNPTTPNESNGTIVLTVSGGTGPYSYSWKNESDNITLSETGGTLNNIESKIYSVVVSDSANHCTYKKFIISTAIIPGFVYINGHYYSDTSWSGTTTKSVFNIPVVTGNTQWASSYGIYLGSTGTTFYDKCKDAAMCCSVNNDPANDATYGKLYNWYAFYIIAKDLQDYNAANPNEEGRYICFGKGNFQYDYYQRLYNYVFNYQPKNTLKLKSTLYWNPTGTNLSGFNAYPSGYRSTGGPFINWTQDVFYFRVWMIYYGIDTVPSSICSYLAINNNEVSDYNVSINPYGVIGMSIRFGTSLSLFYPS